MSKPFDTEDLARRRRRALFMGVALAGLVVLFFVTTIVKMGHSGMTLGGAG